MGFDSVADDRYFVAYRQSGKRHCEDDPCLWCGREFTYQVTNPKDVRKYCSDRCKYKDKRFCKKIGKNSQLSLEKYIIYRWKECVLR